MNICKKSRRVTKAKLKSENVLKFQLSPIGILDVNFCKFSRAKILGQIPFGKFKENLLKKNSSVGFQLEGLSLAFQEITCIQ